MNPIREILCDGTDNLLSSKRVVTMLAFCLCSIGFLADLFWDKKVEEYVFEGMMYIAIAGLGFTASERFTKRKDSNDQNI
jgi:hypothetical protein